MTWSLLQHTLPLLLNFYTLFLQSTEYVLVQGLFLPA
jgi:hypothetical protein